MKTKSSLASVIAVVVAPTVLTGQLSVGEPSLALDRIADQTVPIVFTIDRGGADSPPAGSALWVFAKFATPQGAIADVRWSSNGHSVTPGAGSPGLAIAPATGGPFIPGVFLEVEGRTEAGSWDVELIWDFSTSQIEMPAAGLPIRLWAIEMVRIPAGPFSVGDGRESGQTSTFYSPDGSPYLVESGAEISVGESGQLLYDRSDYGGDLSGPIPEAYPKGFDSYFVMRRELSEGQYAAFLATLSGRALASRDITLQPDYAEAGGSIVVGESAVATDPERPASHITWADAIAWAAWSGLRPMTEFEFEKIARGPDRYGVEAILGGRWERVVTAGTPEGRAFSGSHGWGFVDGLGQPYMFANWDWPGPTALGSGFRGGYTGNDDFSTQGSRVYAAYDATYGGENEGFRAVRTAPDAITTSGDEGSR